MDTNVVIGGMSRRGPAGAVMDAWAAPLPALRLDRPRSRASPDPEDDHAVDCVLNSRAMLVTENLRDFRAAARELGFRLARPSELLTLLEEEP